MTGALPVPDPVVNPETADVWAAAAEGRLVAARCTGCERVVWYPRSMCPHCHAATRPIDCAGTGTVYSCTVTRRGPGEFRDASPYVLAYVELDEGPRMLTDILAEPPESVAIGDRVRVSFVPAPGGSALPRFVLDDGVAP